jgi:predicted dehydrogenase
MGDIGCYSLDMVLNAIGYPKPLTVSGYKSDFFGKNPETFPGHPEYAEIFGVEDFSAGFVRLEGDVILDFRIAWAMHLDTPGDTIIMGTKGSLRIPSTECWNGSVGGDFVLYHEVAGQQIETIIPSTKPGGENNFNWKIRTFLDACKNGTASPVPSSQIIYNQAILDGIARSAELGHEVEINIPEV